ncbi:hypothetical protein BKA69DRAFT_1129763 [Paraphysoderma sedebokerense]|nr:hypothetical protein BKA69DRAFT_1129763 [Paraphysoderma sedebokerense]
MEHLKPIIEETQFLLIKMKLAGRPASSSALAIYQGNVGAAKSICLRADECAKLFDLDQINMNNFLSRHKKQTGVRRKAKSGPNWLINRAMPLKTKETLIDFASK